MAISKLQCSIYKKTGDKRWHITIPAEIVADKGWEKGQKLLFIYNANGDLTLKEVSK